MPRSTESRDAPAEHESAGAGADGQRLHVVLLVAHEARRQWLQALVARIEPLCRIGFASNLVEATLLLTQERAPLLVLDQAFEPEQTLALLHHVARVAPSTQVVAFDESAALLPISPYDVWGWHDAEAVLRPLLKALRSPPSGTQMP